MHIKRKKSILFLNFLYHLSWMKNTRFINEFVPSFLAVTMQSSEKMASPDYLSYGFSVIVALGGVIGYVKAGRCQ